MVTVQRGNREWSSAGFSLVELMIAMGVSVAVLAAAAAITSDVQRTYQHQLHDVTVEQEGRFALDWITRTIESAGANPYAVVTTNCPAAGTPVTAIRLDPNGNGLQDDIRVQADAGVPNGLILGLGGAGTCTEPNEDITIAWDPATQTITRFDRAIDAVPEPQTDGIFTQLQFTYLTAARVITVVPGAIRFVQIRVAGRSRGWNPSTGQPTVFTLQSEVRLRAM